MIGSRSNGNELTEPYDVDSLLRNKALTRQWALQEMFAEINQRFDEHPEAMVLAREAHKIEEHHLRSKRPTPFDKSNWAMVFATIDRDYTLRTRWNRPDSRKPTTRTWQGPSDLDWLYMTAAVARRRIQARTRAVHEDPYSDPGIPAEPAATERFHLVDDPDLDLTPTPTFDPDPPEDGDRARRISEIHEALKRLDWEWAQYEMDWDEYSLKKPLLHTADVPQTQAYNDALFEFRDLANALTPASTEEQITTAEEMGERALLAWDIANKHAEEVGLNQYSLLEARALRQLNALVNQLASPSTPEAMWPALIDKIDTHLKQLKKVNISWKTINALPEIEAGPRLKAIEQRLTDHAAEADQL